MGNEYHPFADDRIVEPPTLPPEALRDIAECLFMVRYWRERAERAESRLRQAERKA